MYISVDGRIVSEISVGPVDFRRIFTSSAKPKHYVETSVTIHHSQFRGTVLLQTYNPVQKFTKLSVITPVNSLALTGVYVQTVGL